MIQDREFFSNYDKEVLRLKQEVDLNIQVLSMSLEVVNLKIVDFGNAIACLLPVKHLLALDAWFVAQDFQSKLTSAKYLNSFPKCLTADDFPTCLAPRSKSGLRMESSFQAMSSLSIFLLIYSCIFLIV